ncbi:hypothetical protein J0B03_05810 [Alkalibacter rhizosphaerae]|uniref:Uncharacterized protein n=1 Tax=Alkalibacter rhizosphaerae TaxID=2815577 RepID=A0A974XJI9_9FIRM|nr:hypothetical protein [Alkalibacter rhizosphaerae]QSX09573.1 hypothetical protein J0B03_05810 [Alkalibacter rhizosphaerae]
MNAEETVFVDDKLDMINAIKDEFLYLNLYRNSEILDMLISGININENDFSKVNYYDLRDFHFLVYCSKQNLPEVLKKLRMQFDINATRNTYEQRGVVRGNIDWQSTFIKRNGINADTSLFIVRDQNREFDTKPNRMLKYILHHLYKLLQDIEKLIPGEIEPEWFTNIASMESSLIMILNCSYIKQVTLVKNITSDLVASGLKHRNPLYRLIGKIAQKYYSVYVKKDPDSIFEIIRSQILVPKSVDKVFEILTLFNCVKTADELKNSFGGKRNFSLLRSKYDNKIIYEYDNGVTINIFYQHTPKSLSSHSRYFDIMKSYGYNAKMAIPDIVVECISVDSSYVSIIEVKYSDDVAYIGTGLQTLLAYVCDYEKAWSEKSKAMLIVKPAVKTTPANEFNNKILIIDKEKMQEKFAELFLNMLAI